MQLIIEFFQTIVSVLASDMNSTGHKPCFSEDITGGSKLRGNLLSSYDLKRLEAYTHNLVDFHMILDLVPILAHQYFQEEMPFTLSHVQASILLCMGLQNKDVTSMKDELGLEREQILSAFIKVMRRLYGHLQSVASKEMDASLPRLKEIDFTPLTKSLDEDLNEAAQEVMEQMRARNEGLLDPELLQQYAINDVDDELGKALKKGGNASASGLVSIKSNKTPLDSKHGKKHEESASSSKRKVKHGDKSSSKKRKS